MLTLDREEGLARGYRPRRALTGLALAAVMAASSWTGNAAARTPEASQLVADLADWAARSGDTGGLPFAVIDKASARVFVFDAQGTPLASTPALLGLAQGDESVPGIGDRELREIREEERTTPAGRFRARFGPAVGQGETFWVDFATAVSLHPVVTGNAAEQRLQRLKSPEAEDNRITYGCINVPKAFYEKVVKATFRESGGIVYVLPETKPLDEVFPSFLAARASSRLLAQARPAADSLGAPASDRVLMPSEGAGVVLASDTP